MIIIKILIFHGAVCFINTDYFRIYCFITLIAIIYTHIVYHMECQLKFLLLILWLLTLTLTGFYVTIHHNNGLFKHDLSLMIL
jgi:hypothetical protein